ncbi:tetratricopeptide repeat protein 1 [Condylostylus longicornis]|uniref:tetratricopeptide repeat protein 1 n=1 Tax=Condylostylus longicornis TaxID=2530218 RepID=UPI00244DBA0D|nr:tetratricopeptide repeat protein 1 [Condylostylus longicornis]
MSDKTCIEEISNNEEVYHDALNKSNEEIIDEIVKSQGELNLSDEIVTDKNDDKEEHESPEVFKDCEEEIYDEEALKEMEKEMTDEQKATNKENADLLKQEGNDLFKNCDYEKCLEKYTKALNIAPSCYPKDRAVLYANRAAAKIKLDSKKSAIDDCTKAISLNEEYTKAYLRRAKLYEETEKLDESFADFKKVLELEPTCKDAQEAVQRLPPLIEERNEKLKTEMMGKLKELGNAILRPFGLSTNNFQMQQDPATGSYSINFKQ